MSPWGCSALYDSIGGSGSRGDDALCLCSSEEILTTAREREDTPLEDMPNAQRAQSVDPHGPLWPWPLAGVAEIQSLATSVSTGL